jgi:hypothetical protein
MRLSRSAAALLALLSASRPAFAQAPPGDDADVEIPASKPRDPVVAPASKPTAAPEPPAPPAAPTAGPAPPPSAPRSDRVELDALRDELRRSNEQLGARIKELEAQRGAPPAGAPPASKGAGASALAWLAPSDVAFSAYLQAQYEQHADSEDQLQQGGAPLNQDRFLVRRGRVRLDAAWRYTEMTVTVDGNTTRGPSFGLRRAEASVLWRGPKAWDGKLAPQGAREGSPPPVKLTLGLMDIPFGFELADSPRDRVFMERSQGSLAFFPGEPDVGVRLSGGLGFFRYAFAFLNGEPIDDRPGKVTRDLNGAKDFVARVGVDTRPAERFGLAGGISVLRGQGFHPGTDATKGSVSWRDLNENSAIDAGEITASPGSAATPSKNFDRWAFGLDLQARLRTALGSTWLYGELTLGQNLDRGLFVADPIVTGIDTREIAAYGALTQEITRYGLVGFRFDLYNPNADFFDKRAAKLVPGSQTISTFSPVVGLALPDRARLLFQYDVIRDLLAKDTQGVPTDLRNDRWTLRLQVQL